MQGSSSLGVDQKRLRHEEYQVIELEKRQKSDDAKNNAQELEHVHVSDSQQKLKYLYFCFRIEKDNDMEEYFCN